MTTAIDPNLTMSELLQSFPGAQRALFRRYHIGGCSSCGFRNEETLAEVCARNENLPVAEVIDHIVTSHEAVDGLARIVVHASGDRVCVVTSDAVTPLPAAGNCAVSSWSTTRLATTSGRR